MNKNVNQGDHRQLVQPQQWTGYVNPQLHESLLQPYPPYTAIPSAPPVSHPQPYDQVHGDVQSSQFLQHSSPPQYQPQPYQPQLYQTPHYQQPNVHSTPVSVNNSVNVNVGGMATPSPYGLAGCCGMGNQQSTITILFVILFLTVFDVLYVIGLIMEGILHKFTYELFFKIVWSVPSAALFPVSCVALDGWYKEKASGITTMIVALNIFWWFVLISAILTPVVFFYLLSLGDTIMGVYCALSFLGDLLVLWIIKIWDKVLTDYRMVMLRRNTANRV